MAKKYGRLTSRQASNLGYLPAKVFVDGIEIEDCVVFDDREGWADVYVKDSKGVYQIQGDHVLTTRVFGKVEYFPNTPDVQKNFLANLCFNRRFNRPALIGLLLAALALICLSVSLSSQTCPHPMTLRQESCSIGLTSCTTKGSELEYEELDFDLLNTLHLCNTVGLFTWPSPASGIFSSNGSGIVSIIPDDDTPDNDSEVPNNITLSGGVLGPSSNTLSGAILTSGLTNQSSQANLGASPRWLGIADSSSVSPTTSLNPTFTLQRWGSGNGTTIPYQFFYNQISPGEGYHYALDSVVVQNSPEGNDSVANGGRIIMEPFGLVTGLGATPSSSGGTLSTNNYGYYIAGVVAGKERLGSAHVTTPVTGPTGSVSLTWTALSGATSYVIYRYLPNSPTTSPVFFTSATNSFTDTGGAGTAGVGRSVTGWGGWFQCWNYTESGRCAAAELNVGNQTTRNNSTETNRVGVGIGLQVVSFGTADTTAAIDLTGESASRFSTGILFSQHGFRNYGIDFNRSDVSVPAIRLGNTQDLVARNAANSSDVHILELDSSNFIRTGNGAVTIDPTNNRLGVITTSPDERFEIEETINSNTIGLVQNLSTGANAISIWRAESDGAMVSMLAHGSGRVATRHGVTLANYGEILQTTGNGLLIGTSAATPIIFGTAATQRMTINSDGSIDIPQMSVPSNPSPGVRRLFVDSSTGKLSVRTSGGSTISLEESGGGGGGNTFLTLDSPNGTDPVADSTADTLTLSDGDGITITGDSTADSLTIAKKDPLKYVDIVEEFCGRNTTSGVTGNLNWSNYGSNTPGTGISDATHPCILSMFTTTTSGNVQGIGLGKNSNEDYWLTAAHLDRVTWVIKTDSIITNTEIRLGFMDDVSSTTGGDGFFVEYDPAVNGFWRCVTRQGGSTTTNNSATTVAINTWYQVELDQDGSGNLRCYVNNSTTPFATNSTNKPTGTLNVGLALETTNTTGKTVYYDFFRLKSKALGTRY